MKVGDRVQLIAEFNTGDFVLPAGAEGQITGQDANHVEFYEVTFAQGTAWVRGEQLTFGP